MNNFKRLNVFVFLSTFARSLIEIFIPLYLYKEGMSFTNILYFYLMILVFSIFISSLIKTLGNKIKYKYFMIISSLSFVLTFYFLNIVNINDFSLVFLAIFYSIYRRCYWMVKRLYMVKYVPKKNSGKFSGFITISSELAGMLSTILGAAFLDNSKFIYLAILSLLILFISIIPLFKIKEEKNEKSKKANYIDILKEIPKQNYFILFFYEAIFFIGLFFPLYLFIYVEETYSFVGIINVLIGISSMVCVYTFSKKMDKDKKDYLSIVTIFMSIIYLFKLNTFNPIAIALIALLEGYFTKMHTTSLSRDTWYLGKNLMKFHIILY